MADQNEAPGEALESAGQWLFAQGNCQGTI